MSLSPDDFASHMSDVERRLSILETAARTPLSSTSGIQLSNNATQNLTVLSTWTQLAAPTGGWLTFNAKRAVIITFGEIQFPTAGGNVLIAYELSGANADVTHSQSVNIVEQVIVPANGNRVPYAGVTKFDNLLPGVNTVTPTYWSTIAGAVAIITQQLLFIA